MINLIDKEKLGIEMNELSKYLASRKLTKLEGDLVMKTTMQYADCDTTIDCIKDWKK